MGRHLDVLCLHVVLVCLKLCCPHPPMPDMHILADNSTHIAAVITGVRIYVYVYTYYPFRVDGLGWNSWEWEEVRGGCLRGVGSRERF